MRVSWFALLFLIFVSGIGMTQSASAGYADELPRWSGKEAPGEPDCWKSGVLGFRTDHCQNRNMYRAIYWKTSSGNLGALRSAAVAVLSYSRNNIKAILLQNLRTQPSRSDYQCVRRTLLGFPSILNSAKSKGSGANLFLGVLNNWGRVLTRINPGTGVIVKIANYYFDAAKKILKVGIDQRLAESAYRTGVNAFTCLA